MARGSGSSMADAFAALGIGTDASKIKEEQERKEEERIRRANEAASKSGNERRDNRGGYADKHHGNTPQRDGQRSRRPRRDDKYAGAPYNFISLPSVYATGKEIVSHASVSEELFSGVIEYSLEAQTPVFVGGQDGMSFYRNSEGAYAIPGSTMRGLIRSHVQILGRSDVSDDIDDYRLMYRNVSNGADKDEYNNMLGADTMQISVGGEMKSISVLKNIKAGYMRCVKGKYVIFGNALDAENGNPSGMNYYVLSERKVIDDYLTAKKQGTKFHYPAFVDAAGHSIMQHDFQPFRKEFDKRNRVHWKGDPNRNYTPYSMEISYEVSGGRVEQVGKPGVFSNRGYAVSTGKMQEKKAIYIIPMIDETKLVNGNVDVREFLIDLNKRETTLKQFGERPYFDLPEEGETKPVFYIDLTDQGKKFYFGFTPRLRLLYEHSIAEGLPERAKGEGYASALFGFARSNDSYKSRLSFSDAEASDKAKLLGEVKYIQGEAKSSSYLDYLVQPEEEIKTYNSASFQIRGIKQYWLHESVEPSNVPPGKENADYVTSFRPLSENTVFSGKIRFHQLKKEELGLLLWAICLESGCQMNVGKAKSFGYGRMKLKDVKVSLFNAKEAYSLTKITTSPYRTAMPDEFIRAFKETEKGIAADKDIQLFFAMKREVFTHEQSERLIRFMSLANREYQSRNNPLPTIQEVVDKLHS